MQRNGLRAFGLGDAARVEVGQVVVIDADAELHRHRHTRGFGAADHGPHDPAEQRALIWQRGPATEPVTFGTGQPVSTQ